MFALGEGRAARGGGTASSGSSGRERLPETLRRWAAAATVAAAFLLLFGRTVADLFSDWAGSGEYGHGFLLLPVALYLGWKGRLGERTPARGWGLAVLAGAVLLFLLGTAAAEFFTRRAAVLGAVAGLTLYYAGYRQLQVWWLPLALLAFTIPLPEVVLNSLTLPLQLLASRAAVEMLEFRHVPALLAGNIIFLPGQQLFVAEACSGLRSLSALLGMTLLIAGTGLGSPWSRGLLLLLAVPAALAANAFRVFATGYAAYFWGPAVAESAMHEAAGIGVFLLALGIVGVAAVGLRRAEAWARRPAPGPIRRYAAPGHRAARGGVRA